MSMGSLTAHRPVSSRQPVTVLDIGSSKVTCLIGKPMNGRAFGEAESAPARMRIRGVGHQPSKGIRAGAIADMEAAEHAIRAAVDQAERMAGFKADSVVVGVSCGRIGGESYALSTGLGGEQVSDGDIRKLLRAGYNHAGREGRTIMHVLPLAYRLDGNSPVEDPRGLYAKRLEADIHVVSADENTLRNVRLCVERCHLDVASYVATPYASGLATLLDDEMRLGAICIDMGGQRTSAAVFHDGKLVFVTSIALGGNHVTMDIARSLSTSMTHAERLKSFYGSALASSLDERELIDVPIMGENEIHGSNRIPKSMLTGIIQPRLEEIFELLRERLEAGGFTQGGNDRLVLAGGASELTGARELASRILGRQARCGRPHCVSGLPESVRGPAFAASAGMLQVSQIQDLSFLFDEDQGRARGAGGYLSRVTHWIQENF